MRMRAWCVAAGFALAGVMAVPATAAVPWSGPGWYVEAMAETFEIFLISGPYTSEDACTPNQPADDKSFLYSCVYETSDPTSDDGP